jgi:type III secretion protein D
MSAMKGSPTAAATNAVPWQLVVLSGPNAGATVPLAAGRIHLGSCIENEIVLADPAIAERQAVLAVDGRRVSLEPLSPGLQSGGKLLRPGRAVELAPGCAFAVGDTTVKLVAPSPRAPRRGAWVAAAVVPLALAGSLSFALAEHPARHGSAVPGAEVSAKRGQLAPAAPADAAGALRTHLAAAGLSQAVEITSLGGAVIAKGTLPADRRPAWQATQVWFDAAFGNRVPMVDQVGTASPPDTPRFAVQAVSGGDLPYVIDASGERFTVGAVVDGGWTISYIGNDKIVFAKNGREVAETL